MTNSKTWILSADELEMEQKVTTRIVSAEKYSRVLFTAKVLAYWLGLLNERAGMFAESEHEDWYIGDLSIFWDENDERFTHSL